MRRCGDGARLLAGDGGGDAVVDGVPEFSATGSASGFDVAEAEAKVGVGFIDGGADEGVPVVDADLGDVAGVVPDGDGVPNERGESRGEVALALKVDAVALHDPVLRNSKEQPVEFLKAVGHTGQPPVGDPCVPRRGP